MTRSLLSFYIFVMLCICLWLGSQPAPEPTVQPIPEPPPFYGLPQELWEHCHYDNLLDMTTEFWGKLPMEEQRKYAAIYRQGYAKTNSLALQSTVEANGESIVLQLIPPARFWMGSSLQHPGRDNDETPHRVLISQPYYLGQYEITQSQWKAVMGENPSYFTQVGLQAPVEQVSYEDCEKFCAKLKLRIPSEAEWEHACHAGTTSMYHFGNDIEYLQHFSWYRDNCYEFMQPKQTHPVGQKLPNTWGLYDMHGNVEEWCEDCCEILDGLVKTSCYYDSEISDPRSYTGSFRVIRGGCYIYHPLTCRVANRIPAKSSSQSNTLGLRVAKFAR